jgi:hypothetical protein
MDLEWDRIPFWYSLPIMEKWVAATGKQQGQASCCALSKASSDGPVPARKE